MNCFDLYFQHHTFLKTCKIKKSRKTLLYDRKIYLNAVFFLYCENN